MNGIDVNTVNPYVRVAMRSVLKQGAVIKQRIIFDYELIYIENGRMTFSYGGAPYQCKAGEFLLIRPGVPHRFDCTNQALSQPHIHFDFVYTPDSGKTPVSFKDLPQLTEPERRLIQEDLFSGFPKTPYVTFSDPGEALALFYGVIDCFNANQKLRAKGMLTELIAQLLYGNFPDRISEVAEMPYGIAQQLKDFIDSAWGVGITLDALEKQFSYSKFHLERTFRKRYGVSLICYGNRKKMEFARETLRVKTVSETAEETGFSSIYSFSRAFKNHFGTSPSEYKKANASAILA